MAKSVLARYSVSLNRALKLFKVSKSYFYYKEKMPERDASLAAEIIRLDKKYKRLGSKKLKAVLMREGKRFNHKAIDRIRKSLGMVAKRRRRRKLEVAPLRLPRVRRPNELWSMDFVHNKLSSHAPFRCLTCVDVKDRKCPGIVVKSSLRALDVINFLEGLKECPKGIVLDNGTEFRSKLFEEWSGKKGITLYFIEKGRPSQNGYVESFNGRLRHECLDLNSFKTVKEARGKIERWRRYYNEARPHGSLGMMTPEEYSGSLAVTH